MNYLTKLSVFTLLCFFQLANAQSPWTKEKGKAFIQLGASGLFYDLAQINGEKVELDADYSDVTTQLYTEYGLTDKLEVQLILPYKFTGISSKTNSFTESLSGLGNITFGLKYKLVDKNWKWAAGLQYMANTITTKTIGNKQLNTGFGANTIIPYITTGSSSGKWYYFGNLGYGYMSNEFSDFLKLDAEVGYKITSKSFLIFAFNSKNVIIEEKAFDNNANLWPSYLDRQTYNAMGLKFNYEFKPEKMGINMAVFGAFGNDNAPLAPSLNIGLYSKL